ncbi:MAG: OadG family protein, partial [Clostridia bacterium]|nr:OadG family protein [Clostridia bacterium]
MKLKTDGIVRSAAVILALTLLFALCFACLTVRAETTGAVAEAGENADAGRFAKSGYPKLDPNAGTGDRAVYGLKIVGIGMGVVFLVLLILMAVLYVFKL